MGMKRRDDLTVTLKTMAIQAVRSGEIERAVKLIEEMNETARNVHDRYCEYVSILLTYIAEAFGEEKVKDAAEFMVNNVHKLWQRRTNDEGRKVREHCPAPLDGRSYQRSPFLVFQQVRGSLLLRSLRRV